MALRRLAGGCMDVESCPGIWVDDQHPDHVLVVGVALEPSPVPLGPGEAVVRLPRQTVHDASIGA